MFKKNFINFCNKKGVAPTVVCQHIGLSAASYSKWTDESVPRKATLMRLADYLGVTVDDLLADDAELKEKPADNADEPIDQTDQTILNLLKLFPQEERQAIIAELAARLAEKK